MVRTVQLLKKQVEFGRTIFATGVQLQISAVGTQAMETWEVFHF